MEVGAVPRESPPAPSTPPARAATTDGTAGAGARTGIAAAQMAVPTGTAIALASTSTLVRYPAGAAARTQGAPPISTVPQ
jgi:hypothetical protein